MATRKKNPTGGRKPNGDLLFPKPPALNSVSHVPLYQGVEKKKIDVEGAKPVEIEIPISVMADERFADVKVGVRYLGPGKLQEWEALLLGFKIKEAQRMAATRKGLTQAIAPELWETGNMTAEGYKAFDTVCSDIFDEAIEDMQGIEGGENRDVALAFLRGFGAAEKFSIINLCKQMQGLERSRIFAAGTRGLGSK